MADSTYNTAELLAQGSSTRARESDKWMFFFHDECDLIDDDQYDLFTLTTHIERKSEAASGKRRSSKHRKRCQESHSHMQTAPGPTRGAGADV